MKVTDCLNLEKKAHVSFEITPPKFGEGKKRGLEILEQLMPYHPDFVSITFHQEKKSYDPNGEENHYEKVVEKPKVGTVPLCALLEGHYNIPMVQHLLCGGFNREETAWTIKELGNIPLDNIFALRGDPNVDEKMFTPEEGGHRYASELVEQISSFNRGKHRLNGVLDKIQTDFCIGVAGYPEKHYEAPNFGYDLQKLKDKVDQGAHYIITQMFYDNTKFFQFVEQARELGITIPIIPGLNPLLKEEDLTILPRTFHLTIPQQLVDKIYSNKPIKEVSIDWLTTQCTELLKSGIVPDLHFFTEGRKSKIDIVGEVYRRIYD